MPASQAGRRRFESGRPLYSTPFPGQSGYRRKNFATVEDLGMLEGLFQPAHLLILIVGGLCSLAVIVGVVLLVVALTRRQNPDSNQLSSLEAENHRLREEIDRLKRDKA